MFSGCGVGVEPRTPQNLIRIGSFDRTRAQVPGVVLIFGERVRFRQLPRWFTAGRPWEHLPYNEPRGLTDAGPTEFLMPHPEFKEFLRLARSATLVPVVKSVSADLLTPVS